MIYIFDTSSLIVLNHFYPSTFPSLWSGLEQLITNGSLISTREVLNELRRLKDREFVCNWANQHKSIFITPTNAELEFVEKILAIRHFEQLISQKALLRGDPVADPFVIAAAAIKKGTVVSQEKFKENAAKISNVCKHFDIPCIDLEGFMTRQNWQF